jgi:molybdopterin synthase sulfur carrier subunit
VRVLYFAWLRQKVGVAEESLVPPAEVGTVGGLIDWLAAQSPAHADAFAHRGAIRCAVNQDFATAATRVGPGDEVAFFPPVTGG